MSCGVAIIGAGLIGGKRAEALKEFDNCRLLAVADRSIEAAENLGRRYGAEAASRWRDFADRKDIDVVVVATYNKSLAPITIDMLKAGKHVLCEKPLGRNSAEAGQMVETAKENGVVLKTGFNHRCHPAIAAAKRLLCDGRIGRLFSMRCRYGHGGREGYEKEWRASKDICGGGELLDQGVHVVDLFRFFAGDFDEAVGYVQTHFWDMQVEDNAYAIFRKDNGVVATMHTSWTQWKNLFSFEMFGAEGYLIIDGLGGSYGTETLTIGRRKSKGGPPDEETISCDGPDDSWQTEWSEFVSAVEKGTEPDGNGWDGYQANRMLEAVYKSAKTKQVVRL